MRQSQGGLLAANVPGFTEGGKQGQRKKLWMVFMLRVKTVPHLLDLLRRKIVPLFNGGNG